MIGGSVVRLLVVDDHDVFATSVGRAISDEPDIEVVDTVSTAAAAREAVGRDVDVVLCDFRLGDGDGASLTAEFRETHPDVKVVMLTASEDDSVLLLAIDAGCCGFLTKTQPLDEVLAAVRSAAAGESVVSPALLARLLARLGRTTGSAPDELTTREQEVLEVMSKGGSNQAIADELFVSRDTIRNHVASILRKLGAHSKLEAVSIAVQRGLVRIE